MPQTSWGLLWRRRIPIGYNLNSAGFLNRYFGVSQLLVFLGAIAATAVVGAAPALADLEREYNVYAMDFEVTSQKANESWRLTVNQYGKRVYSNARTAFQDVDDLYADVDWEIVRPDKKGVADRFTLTLTSFITGEVCKSTLRG